MLERLLNDLKNAMKTKDKKRLMVLRSLKSDIKNSEIELGHKLSEDELINIFRKGVKSREQSIALYLEGGRDDLAEIEQYEVSVIKEYLPSELTRDEIESEVTKIILDLKASSMKDMGKVMKEVLSKIGNQADGKTISSIVKEKLS